MASAASRSRGNEVTVGRIVLDPMAYCVMALHASHHRHESVHGFLLGTVTAGPGNGGSAARVTGAVPVSHGSVTEPLVEMALGLCDAEAFKDENGVAESAVIGWYTAPRLLLDGEPGPVDARIAATLLRRGSSGADGSFSNETGPGVLVVLQNRSLGGVLKGDGDTPLFASAPAAGTEVVVVESAKAARATREAVQQGILLEDFVDHLECSTATASSWLKYTEIADLISKC
jgi:hypothetical protein